MQRPNHGAPRAVNGQYLPHPGGIKVAARTRQSIAKKDEIGRIGGVFMSAYPSSKSSCAFIAYRFETDFSLCEKEVNAYPIRAKPFAECNAG
ncbi:MAG: hypothetical protein AB7G39_14920 [Alphaproteobacteria bacterium]